MGTIKNFRTTADVTMNTKLKDGGVYIDWASMTEIRAWIYSDAQKALAGRVDVTIDQQDSTKAVLVYAGTKAQYPGVNRLIVQARYNGSLKTYDKAVFNFVPRTAEATGNVTIDEPETDVEIVVQDVSSSILDATILAALAAADRANEAAEAAEHMTDIHQGPPGPAGKAPYIDETTGNWFVWDDDEDAYVDSEIHAQGVAGNGIASWSVVESDQDGGSNVVTVTFTDGNSETFTYKNGHTGATPQISIGTVETGAAGSEAEASMTGTAAAPLLNLKIPKGDPGVAEVCYKHVTTLPTAAAGTMNALYLVDTQTANVYDVYYTSYDGSAYSWVQLGTTTVNLSDYATKTELNQLEAEVGDLSDLQTTDKASIVDAINEVALRSGFPGSAASLLIEILRKAVYVSDDAGDEIDDLEDLIVVNSVTSVSAVFTPGTEVFYYGEYLDVLRPYLVVTANYSDGTSEVVQDYTITGELNSATNTITIHYRGKTDTISVNATEPIHFRGEGGFVKRLQSISSYTSTTKNPAQIDGVFYYFTRVSYTGDTKPDKRCSYYLFDLALTPSKKYEFLLLVEDDQEYTMQMGLQYYDSTFQSIGQANNDPGESINYDSHTTDPGWKTLTKVGRFYRYEYTTPSNRVGIRLTLRIGTNDNTEWPLTTQTIKELIINEVNNG